MSKNNFKSMAVNFKSVDDYIAAQPHAVHAILERVRSAILKALPAADEVISYKMPTYKLHGETLLHFAGWKQHYSLYPASGSLVAAFVLRARESGKSNVAEL